MRVDGVVVLEAMRWSDFWRIVVLVESGQPLRLTLIVLQDLVLVRMFRGCVVLLFVAIGVHPVGTKRAESKCDWGRSRRKTYLRRH